jgi:hypothetical protein
MDMLKSAEIMWYMLDATRKWDKPMTLKRLCSWHAALVEKGILRQEGQGRSTHYVLT